MSAEGTAGSALWYAAPGRAELRRTVVPRPGPAEAGVRTFWTGVSRGTERLVLNGLVPESERERMRAPMQEGAFPFPVKYGYAAVGMVEDGPAELLGRTVFALHPHQDRFTAPTSALLPVPDGVPARRAVLAANMETALNAVWDSGVGPGDRIAVVGGGVVGLLVAYLASRLPGAEATVFDVVPERRGVAERLGARFRSPAEGLQDADVVFHASATSAGLALALDCAGQEACVVELSWYGEGEVALPLGRGFHSRRLRLVSSQVGQVAPSRRPRWTHARRLAKALHLLASPELDALLTGEVPFGALPDALPQLLAPGAPGLCTAVRYGDDGTGNDGAGRGLG